ncbi:MAG: sensor histidine kinase [Campylobacteraceae bacterium]|nr:sensor histidine kinase [Campylobacteraceae bacterium]
MKGIVFERNIAEGCIVEVNKTKLYRLIDNNLSNAVKYSNENSKIEIRLQKVSEDEALLSFKDYGIGIERPEKIFERYYREELAKGGFGLGLNIVKNICDDEGIKIDVVSKIDEGSEFRYLFRIAKVASNNVKSGI